MSEKYRLNGITFDVKYKGDDNGADWTEMESDDISITLKGSNRKPEELGATLVKEPRKITVWEWRKFDAKFNAGDEVVYRWIDGSLCFQLPSGNYEEKKHVFAPFLESIGTEVL